MASLRVASTKDAAWVTVTDVEEKRCGWMSTLSFWYHPGDDQAAPKTKLHAQWAGPSEQKPRECVGIVKGARLRLRVQHDASIAWDLLSDVPRPSESSDPSAISARAPAVLLTERRAEAAEASPPSTRVAAAPRASAPTLPAPRCCIVPGCTSTRSVMLCPCHGEWFHGVDCHRIVYRVHEDCTCVANQTEECARCRR